jgi:hypothetical protein
MPFENTMVVIALRRANTRNGDYFLTEKQPHPLAGLTLFVIKKQTSKNILVQGKTVEKTKYIMLGPMIILLTVE